MLFSRLFLVFLVFLGLDLAQVQVATGNILQLLAVVFAEVTHHPLVDAICKEQHLNTLLAEHFRMRAALGRSEVVGSDVIKLLLPFSNTTSHYKCLIHPFK